MNSFLLETTRLLLAPFSAADAEKLHQLWTQPAVRKFLWDDQLIPLETVYEVIEAGTESFANHRFGFWALRLKDNPELIGFCGLRHFELAPGESPEVEILYGLEPQHWGKGLATEASLAVLHHGFEKARLEQIYAGADPPNQTSFRVMQRLGMKFARGITLQGVNGKVTSDYYVLKRAQFEAEHPAGSPE